MGLVKMQVQITRILIVQVRGWAAKARREGRSDVGASAIEWAIISALVVGETRVFSRNWNTEIPRDLV